MTQTDDISLQNADAEQARLMEERVILVDRDDNVVGAGSKKETHVWKNIQDGLLHRAFSVFLITPEGRLLLQKRSDAKITFPAYWANTCCSHPLHMESELETKDALGVKNAARRKMQQELGINPEDVPLSSFQFVTRIHYSAPCGKHGRPEDFWGEHEIDHVLICLPPKTPRVMPNPNEVAEVRAFSPAELAQWVSTAEQRGDRVSPWFRLMERTMLYRWWSAAAHGLKSVRSIMETSTIHRLDDLKSVPQPNEVDMEADVAENAWKKASGKAIPVAADRLGTIVDDTKACENDADQVAKQGAYGKVATHKENIFRQLSHLDEVWGALLFKLGVSDSAKVISLPSDASESHKWCEKMLTRVSRSFAMVIQQLSPRLRKSIAAFYLVLRGLDTVEDDMIAFMDRESEKIAHLRAFYTYLDNLEWNMRGVGEGHEAILLEQFQKVSVLCHELPEDDFEVIQDICRRMGHGMSRYVSRDLREGTRDVSEYNLYCHYVAGLVGEGLSRLFAATGREDKTLANDRALANEMGLFLQKTNIIRDYLEDFVEGRAFWPKSIWGKYAQSLGELRGAGGPSDDNGKHAHIPHKSALPCLNHLIADALSHAPACLRYLSRIQSNDIFRFCAIPQVMAIATLDKICNNMDVYTGVVKIRKGKALWLIANSDNMNSAATIFLKHARSIAAKVPSTHKPAYDLIQRAAADTESQALALLPPAAAAFHSNVVLSQLFSLPTVGVVLALLAFLLQYLYRRSPEWAESNRYLPRITDSWDVAALTGVVGSILYLMAFTGVPLAMAAGSSLARETETMTKESKLPNGFEFLHMKDLYGNEYAQENPCDDVIVSASSKKKPLRNRKLA